MTQPIYLDHSATTPLHPQVLEAMMPFFTGHHGNPGSLHRFGRRARVAIQKAREQTAALIGAEPEEIYFTSGGTEANNWLLHGLTSPSEKNTPPRPIACSAVEHHSVLDPTRHHNQASEQTIPEIPVDASGTTSPNTLPEDLPASLRLLSMQWANNETGRLQPIEAWHHHCQQHDWLLHSDAVQAVGKIPIDVQRLSLDALTLSAHKLQGPKGIGAAYVRHGHRLTPLLRGGAQERGLRAGTESVAAIVGMGKACELAQENLTTYTTRVRELRDRLETQILEQVPDAWCNGQAGERLPHISNLGFAGLEGEALMMALDAAQIAVSTGSACSSGSLDPSHVLLAMGQSHPTAQAAIRISLGLDTTVDEIDRVIQTLPSIVQGLRNA